MSDGLPKELTSGEKGMFGFIIIAFFVVSVRLLCFRKNVDSL